MTTQQYQRVALATTVDGEAGLPNRTKFADLQATRPREPLEGFHLDADMNTVFDALNELYDTAVTGVVPDDSITLAKLSGLTAGSIYIMDGSGDPAELTVGSDGEFLTVSSGLPAWTGAPASPTGSVTDFAGSTAPSGWLLCDGSAVSRATYSALFSTIGTTYGSGDGSTTFNVPDLRGRVAAGLDNMGGSSADRVTDSQADTLNGELGTEDGTATGSVSTTVDDHVLIEAELPAHSHTQRVLGGVGTSPTQSNATYKTGSLNPAGDPSGNYSLGYTPAAQNVMGGTANLTTANTGSGDGHNHTASSTFTGDSQTNLPPTLFMNKIIKT
jgi:microcystin-dependent protein